VDPAAWRGRGGVGPGGLGAGRKVRDVRPPREVAEAQDLAAEERGEEEQLLRDGVLGERHADEAGVVLLLDHAPVRAVSRSPSSPSSTYRSSLLVTGSSPSFPLLLPLDFLTVVPSLFILIRHLGQRTTPTLAWQRQALQIIPLAQAAGTYFTTQSTPP